MNKIWKHDRNVRYGAFLRSIPLHRRVGDYAHCAARVVNATLKRLTKQSFKRKFTFINFGFGFE